MLSLGFLNLGPLEWTIIGVIALLLFGGRLPEVARAAGKAIVEFRKGVRDVEEDFRKGVDEATDDSKKPGELPKSDSRTVSQSSDAGVEVNESPNPAN